MSEQKYSNLSQLGIEPGSLDLKANPLPCRCKTFTGVAFKSSDPGKFYSDIVEGFAFKSSKPGSISNSAIKVFLHAVTYIISTPFNIPRFYLHVQ